MKYFNHNYQLSHFTQNGYKAPSSSEWKNYRNGIQINTVADLQKFVESKNGRIEETRKLIGNRLYVEFSYKSKRTGRTKTFFKVFRW